MNVIILDKNFNPLAPVNSMRTLIWDRRAKEPGMFELHCGAADFEGIDGGAYVYRQDRDELGVIQEADLGRDESGARICYAKGYFAEAMLSDRVVDVTENLSGTPEDIARDLVTKYFIAAGSYPGRSVPAIELGQKSTYPQTPTKLQATGKPVGSVITGIEETQDMMHRLRFDMARGKLVFTMTQGQDRGAIFSDEYANIRSASYHKDSTDAPNVVFVAGAGEGAARKRVIIDLREDPTEYAREMYVDARDLQQSWEEDGVTKYYTDEDYNTLLENRGMEKIAGHKVLENFQVDADPTANLVYRTDYDVGDWCTVRVTVHGSLKFELLRQITAIKETYEAGKASIAITFGDYGPRSLDGYVARTVSVNEVVPSVAAGGGEDLSKLETDDKSSLVKAVNEVDRKGGSLKALKTKENTSLVGAVNEVLGDVGDVETLTTEEKSSTVGAINELDKQAGDLSKLQTTDKSSLVAAINEAAQSGGGGGTGGAEQVVLSGGKTTQAIIQNTSAGLYNRRMTVVTLGDPINAQTLQSKVRRKYFVLGIPVQYRTFKPSSGELCDVMVKVAEEVKLDTGDSGSGSVRICRNMWCRLCMGRDILVSGTTYTAYYPRAYEALNGATDKMNDGANIMPAAVFDGICTISAPDWPLNAAMLTQAASVPYSGDVYEAWPVFEGSISDVGDKKFYKWAEVKYTVQNGPSGALSFVRWL